MRITLSQARLQSKTLSQNQSNKKRVVAFYYYDKTLWPKAMRRRAYFSLQHVVHHSSSQGSKLKAVRTAHIKRFALHSLCLPHCGHLKRQLMKPLPMEPGVTKKSLYSSSYWVIAEETEANLTWMKVWKQTKIKQKMLHCWNQKAAGSAQHYNWWPTTEMQNTTLVFVNAYHLDKYLLLWVGQMLRHRDMLIFLERRAALVQSLYRVSS